MAALVLIAMTDLVCERCGASATYHGASRADAEKTCPDTFTGPDGREYESGQTHEWVEKLNDDIDVITG